MKSYKQPILILSKALAFGHFLFLIGIFSSCDSKETAHSYFQLQINAKDTIDVRLAISEAEQTQGLSGVKEDQLKAHQGMLFIYDKPGPRAFWMPDTYFDLDLFYLDKDFRVLDIYRGLKHHPTRNEPPAIPRAPAVYARHVLELKSSSPLAKKIRKFQQLTWKKGQSLPKKLQGIHPLK